MLHEIEGERAWLRPSFRPSSGSGSTTATSKSSSACPRSAWRSSAAQDTGTLQHDTYFNDDETECIVIERFRDSEALIQHGENLAHLMDAIIATGSVFGELLGEPERELRAQFTGGGPVQLFTPWATM